MLCELNLSDWKAFLKSIEGKTHFLSPWREETRYEHQVQIFRYIAGITQPAIDYFEFGVASGNSFKIALDVWSHQQSRFFGFDTFTGLPCDWLGRIESYSINGQEIFLEQDIRIPQGHFCAKGRDPTEAGILDDLRVVFYKGLVEETLPSAMAQYTSGSQKVVNIDINLYKPTCQILSCMHSYFRPGDIVVFDELYDVQNEFKAFREYVQCFDLAGKIQCVCTDGKVFAFQI